MTQSSDVQGNINKIIIVKVKFIVSPSMTRLHSEYSSDSQFSMKIIYQIFHIKITL